MPSQLSYGYRIESEIGNDGEYREVVVDLGIESISCDIEVSCDHLDHSYRDECCDDLGSYLGERIDIDFSGRHMS
jgi:hypothetical protein